MKTAPAVSRHTRRIAEAISLKVAGWTYAQIGTQFGVTANRAQQLVRPPEYIVTQLKKRAGNCCEKCGIPIRGRMAQVHHRRCQPEFNSLDNLLYLCPSCHGSEHAADKMNEIRMEPNFLGSGWTFIELADGSAHWIHKSGKSIDSSRNAEMVANRTPEEAVQAARSRRTA